MKKAASYRGFTLVELLVVVAIIIILIAILVPSVISAMYLATLAKCGANQSSIGKSVLTYSQNNKGRYPHRSAIRPTLDAITPAATVGLTYYAGYLGTLQGSARGTQKADDRPLLSTIVSISKHLQDPFVDAIDLEDPASYDANDQVSSSYDLFWGWGYSGEGHMLKYGNRVTWKHPATGVNYKWNLLAMDRESSVPGSYDTEFAGRQVVWNDITFASHPDDEGKLAEAAQKPESNEGVDYWSSQWMGPAQRTGHSDRNFLRDDGSVERLDNILFGPNSYAPITAAGTLPAEDERMVVAPADTLGDPTFGTILLPKR